MEISVFDAIFGLYGYKQPKIKVKRIVSEKIVWYNREQMRKCKNNRCFKDRCKNGKIRGILRWLFGNCASQNRIERR